MRFTLNFNFPHILDTLAEGAARAAREAVEGRLGVEVERRRLVRVLALAFPGLVVEVPGVVGRAVPRAVAGPEVDVLDRDAAGLEDAVDAARDRGAVLDNLLQPAAWCDAVAL